MSDADLIAQLVNGPRGADAPDTCASGLRCAQCGRDLSGTRRGGGCPECAFSTTSSELAALGPPWLHLKTVRLRVRWGIGLITLSSAWQATSWLFALGLDLRDFAFLPAFSVLGWISYLAANLGGILLATPWDIGGRWRWWRCVALAAFVVALLLTAGRLFLPSTSSRGVAMAHSLVSLAVYSIQPFALALLVLEVARRGRIHLATLFSGIAALLFLPAATIVVHFVTRLVGWNAIGIPSGLANSFAWLDWIEQWASFLALPPMVLGTFVVFYRLLRWPKERCTA